MKKNVFFLSLAILIGLSTWMAKAGDYGDGDLKDIINGATANEVINLTGTTYTYSVAATLDKTLTIQADPALSSRPQITCTFASAGILFTAAGSADQSLTLKGLEFAGNALATCLTKTNVTYKFTVSVDNCKTSGFATGENRLFSYTACAAGTTNGDLTVSNSEFVGAKPNSLITNTNAVVTPNNISFTNCLIRDFASANTAISIALATGVSINGITLDHCTFKNGSTGTTKLISTPTSNAPMLVKNCIFVDIPSSGTQALQSNTNNQKNVVYNVGGTISTQFAKFGSVTYPILLTNPALNATTFVTSEATYLNAGTDGLTIGYNVPVAAVAPSAPTGLTFTTPANATSLSVSFTAGYNGGSPITDYKYSINSGTFVSAGVTTSPINITGLNTATSYNIQIKAVNSAGDGAASATATGRTSQTVVYVSTTGNDVTGDGLTVGTPVATFARAIAISCPATTNIYLAAGNYVQTTTASLNALSNINLTISGESASNTTISTATSAVRLLVANAAPFSTSTNTVTIRNLTFSGANITANNGYGGAIQFNQGVSNAMQSSLILENMIFDNNKVSASGGTGGAGGALSTNFKNVTITDCYFKNNQALSSTSAPATGGAIFVGPINGATGDTSGSFVNISNTTFDGNVATSKGGAVLVNNNVGPATLPTVTPYAKFTNCTFVNNKVLSQPTDATTNIKNGSAICFNSTTTAGMYQFAYTIANCTFAKNQGGINAGTGSVWESKSAVQFDGTNWTSATLVNNIFAPSLTANCGTTLSVSDAESTKFTAEYNAIESVDALSTDATFVANAAANHNYIAAFNPSNLNATLTDNSTGSVFAVPYLGIPYASAAKNAGVDTYTGGIVPTLDVRGQAIVGTKDLGAFENTGTANSVISTTGTLSAVNTTYGTASASPTTFSVSGADMTAGILVTPPAGYEVSLSSGSGYASTVTVTGTGTISSTPVYVRLAATTAVGSYSGNIVLSSTGATSANVATVSSAVAAAAADKTGGDITALGLTDTELENTDVTISSGELVVNVGKTVRSITINGGAKLTVPTGQTLTLTNLTLKSNDTSTATYKPEGTGALVVTGSTAVEQYLATTRNWYVSSPVNNALAPEGYTYFSRDESGSNPSPVAPATAYWVSVAPGAGLSAGKGYIALPSNAALPITFTTQSGGSLNTGNVTIPITYTSNATSGKGYNLIGNPYPSHLSWTPTFATANAAKIDASIWYRTNSSGSNATGWSFVTYNPITGEAVPSIANGGIIPPMQAFWVLAKETGSIQFTNDMRSHETGNPLKAPATKSADRKKLRLQVSNGTRVDEVLIVFDANASDSYDAFDSPKMMNNATDIADIYTVIDAKKLVINGMSSLNYNTEIPVGFSTLVAGDFSISANEFSNFETDAQVILLDKELTKEFDLSKGASYNFSSGITVANANRFSLLFRAPSSPNALNTVEKLNAQVFVNAANQITIIAPEKANYVIYNAMGQLINNGILNTKHETVNTKLAAGMYVVRVSENGKELTTRVIIK